MTVTEPKRRNRRNGSRRTPRGSVKLECPGAFGLGKNIAARFLDISEGGVRLVVTQALLLKQEVEVVIFTNKTIKRVANVSWMFHLEDGNFCLGLEFQKRLLFAEVSQSAKL